MSTILRRIFVDGYRNRRRRACRVAIEERLGWTASSSDPQEPSVWEAFTVEDVQRALAVLDPASRETFSLFAFADLAQDEIARRLSISRQTVATRVFRTRGKLREVLASGEYRHRGAAVGRSPRRAA
jgi:RNA polymerase sigma factor (sigma-70 family)